MSGYTVVDVFINPGLTESLRFLRRQISELVTTSIGHLTGQKPGQNPVVNIIVRSVGDPDCGVYIRIQTSLTMFGEERKLAQDVQGNEALNDTLISVLDAGRRSLLVSVERSMAVWAG